MLIEEIYLKHPKTIHQDTTVGDALKMFIKDKFNGLIVVDNREKVVGVLSIQDIAAATIPTQFRKNLGMAAAMYKKGFFHEMCAEIKDKPIKAIMRRNFQQVDLTDNIMAVTADFLKNDLYIVPVIEKGKLVGVITRSEIKAALAYGMNLAEYGSLHHNH